MLFSVITCFVVVMGLLFTQYLFDRTNTENTELLCPACQCVVMLTCVVICLVRFGRSRAVFGRRGEDHGAGERIRVSTSQRTSSALRIRDSSCGRSAGELLEGPLAGASPRSSGQPRRPSGPASANGLAGRQLLVVSQSTETERRVILGQKPHR